MNRCLLLACMVLIRCSPDTTVAGGTGAGNPGPGYTTIAVAIDTASSLSKTIAQGPIDSNGQQGRNPEVRDSGNTLVTIDTLLVSVQRIIFIPESTQRPCESVITGTGTPLMCRYGGLSLEGARKMDPLSRAILPAPSVTAIPVGTYSGINFHVSTTDYVPLGQTDTTHRECCPFRISGTFQYQGQQRRFVLTAASNTMLSIRPAGAISITEGDTVAITVSFASRSWLTGVDIKGCLDRGDLAFAPDGILYLQDDPGMGPCGVLAARVKDNVLGSGRWQKN